ncbi:MAG TPA: helix-turn-helix transcriptional regulator [Anaerolineaceae bacterium]|jgi:transcriptional regulator with XRE-family HTH domain|nr:helix-turn-helix transcriptional regulator [Anaerolineaceae bacterium]
MMNTIGQKVKELREKAGLNQMHIAQFLEMDQSTISKCEKGERQFQVDHLERLGNLFGVSLSDLMNEDVPVAHLQIAFRANGIQVEDLNAIADIQKIALNLDKMHAILRENLHEA